MGSTNHTIRSQARQMVFHFFSSRLPWEHDRVPSPIFPVRSPALTTWVRASRHPFNFRIPIYGSHLTSRKERLERELLIFWHHLNRSRRARVAPWPELARVAAEKFWRRRRHKMGEGKGREKAVGSWAASLARLYLAMAMNQFHENGYFMVITKKRGLSSQLHWMLNLEESRRGWGNWRKFICR